jgi:hypothetical protein
LGILLRLSNAPSLVPRRDKQAPSVPEILHQDHSDDGSVFHEFAVNARFSILGRPPKNLINLAHQNPHFLGGR